MTIVRYYIPADNQKYYNGYSSGGKEPQAKFKEEQV